MKTMNVTLKKVLSAPLLFWIVTGFLISFLLFFIKPIFFSSTIMQFPEYIQTIDPIGYDLKQMRSYSESLFINTQTPYIGNNLYPPLASVLFGPFLFLTFTDSYKILSLITFFAFVFLPFLLRPEKGKITLTLLFILAGLFSYGFQFELERGQFNIISMFFCFLGLWIFYYQKKSRILAYIFFSLSIQLKVFPLIFILLFVDTSQRLKTNVLRLAGLALSNFLLLFILGPGVFLDFFHAIKAQTINPGIWIGNHSIKAFITLIQGNDPGSFPFSNAVEFILLGIIIINILLVFYKTLDQKHTTPNPYLLLACSLGALLIPSVSHDYKLSILVAPFAYFICKISDWEDRIDSAQHRLLNNLLVLFFSIAYFSTSFSYTNKYGAFVNNFPMLFLMLLLLTFLHLLHQPGLPSLTRIFKLFQGEE